MSPAAASDLHALLRFVRSEYGARAFLFFSGSMGGTSNLIYSVLHPADVQAAGALCPAVDLASYYAWCRARDAGVIREGGPADFALVHGDPLSDPTALWRVWHASWA